MHFPAAPGGPGDLLPPAAGAPPSKPSSFLTGSIKHVSFRGKEEPLTFNAFNKIIDFKDFENFVKDKMKIPREDEINIQIEGYNPKIHWEEFKKRVSSGHSEPIETMYIEQVASASISPKEVAVAAPKAPPAAAATPVATPFLTGTLCFKVVEGSSEKPDKLDMTGIRDAADLEDKIKQRYPDANIYYYGSPIKLTKLTPDDLQTKINNSRPGDSGFKIAEPAARSAATGTPAGPAALFLTGTLYIQEAEGKRHKMDMAGIKDGADLEDKIKQAFPGANILPSFVKKLSEYTQSELQKIINDSWRVTDCLKIKMPKAAAAGTPPAPSAPAAPAGAAASSGPPRAAVATPVAPPAKPAAPFLTGALRMRVLGGQDTHMDMARIRNGADLEEKLKQAYPGAKILVCLKDKKLTELDQDELQKLIDNETSFVRIIMPQAPVAAVPSAAARTPAGAAASSAPPRGAAATAPAGSAAPFLKGNLRMTLYKGRTRMGSEVLDVSKTKNISELEILLKQAFPGGEMILANQRGLKLTEFDQNELQALIEESIDDEYLFQMLMPLKPASSASPAPEETPPIVVTPPPLDRRAARPPLSPPPETLPPQEKSTLRTFWESIWPS